MCRVRDGSLPCPVPYVRNLGALSKYNFRLTPLGRAEHSENSLVSRLRKGVIFWSGAHKGWIFLLLFRGLHIVYKYSGMAAVTVGGSGVKQWLEVHGDGRRSRSVGVIKYEVVSGTCKNWNF